jgi:hypothetical protein
MLEKNEFIIATSVKILAGFCANPSEICSPSRAVELAEQLWQILSEKKYIASPGPGLFSDSDLS